MIITQEMYNAAKKAGACSKHLNLIKPHIGTDYTGEYAAEWAHWYACEVLKDRWPEAEPVIAKDAQWAYCYACYVVKDRWPEAEPVIAKDAEWAYCYARYVVKDRWPEADGQGENQ